jgi:hypothetical protein
MPVSLALTLTSTFDMNLNVNTTLGVVVDGQVIFASIATTASRSSSLARSAKATVAVNDNVQGGVHVQVHVNVNVT